MTDPDTKRAVVAVYHGLRSAGKKGRKIRDPEFTAQRQAEQRARAQETARGSIYPPGWDGEPWKPWGED